MRRLLCALLLVVPAVLSQGQDVDGRALVTFENYDNESQTTSGLRQSYDLGLQGMLTTTSIVRLLFHADDFRGTTEVGRAGDRESGSRVLQPSGEFMMTAESLRVLLRGDYYDTTSTIDGLESQRTMERSLAQVAWRPSGSSELSLNAQRNVTNDPLGNVHVVDEIAVGTAAYSWKALQFNGAEKYAHTTEAGFDRNVLGHQAALDFASSHFGDRLTLSANATAIANVSKEKLVDDGAQVVPIPVAISRGLFAIDDTPTDGRDHPPSPYPGLVDGNLEVGANVTLSPSSVSFQNLVIDLGRIDRLDEIRVVVRDAAGNPLRNGGGPVAWDVYVSEDGQIWTPILEEGTSFDRALSRYEIAFSQTYSRWFKIVNFGVNAEETLVTEIQGVYHATFEQGTARDGSDRYYGGGATIVAKPFRRLTFFYNGGWNTMRREYTETLESESTYLEHLGSLEYQLLRSFAVRGEYSTRKATLTGRRGSNDNAESATVFLLYKPTRQLTVTGEIGRQEQILDAAEFSIDTRALHVDAAIYRSLSILLNVGTQTQTLGIDDSTAIRHFLDLTAQARLTRTLRLLLLASFQRVDSQSADPAVQFLGITRDDRASAELIWRPGRPLTLAVRGGYVSGHELSGFTHRIRADWQPFDDGALVLGGSWDQDIDPVLDRRATRAVFNPRWLINRWATFDLNYTSVSLTSRSSTQRQRTLFATLTLSR
jgi:hypothetical protein